MTAGCLVRRCHPTGIWKTNTGLGLCQGGPDPTPESGRNAKHVVKSILLTLLKILLPIAVIAWLLSRLEPEQVTMLREQPKDWGLLIAAFVLTFVAVSLSFLRWWLLVWALGLPFRILDAFRLGFIGYLMNFVSAGAVGGDLVKAFFIAREQPGRRAEAVATVVVEFVESHFGPATA